MPMFRPPENGRLYVGRVYDGPCEGSHIENDGPYYMALHLQHQSVASYGNHLPCVGMVSHQVLYKWSRDIRAWVWVQR